GIPGTRRRRGGFDYLAPGLGGGSRSLEARVEKDDKRRDGGATGERGRARPLRQSGGGGPPPGRAGRAPRPRRPTPPTPHQTTPAARLAAIITATAATPAIAVNRTAVKILGAGLPCAERRRPVSAIANATELHTSPHPAIGSPVAFCTPEANAPFQTAEQSSL